MGHDIFEKYLYPPKYETNQMLSLGCHRIFIINAGYVCSSVEKSLYLFFGVKDKASFALSFDNFDDQQQLEMALNQMSELMTRQNKALYVYSVNDNLSAPYLSFNTKTGKVIRSFIPRVFFDGNTIKGIQYNDSDEPNGAQDIQKFINSMVVKTTAQSQNVATRSICLEHSERYPKSEALPKLATLLEIISKSLPKNNKRVNPDEEDNLADYKRSRI